MDSLTRAQHSTSIKAKIRRNSPRPAGMLIIRVRQYRVKLIIQKLTFSSKEFSNKESISSAKMELYLMA